MGEMTFYHCSDIHLGKTYADSPGAEERYEDFFRVFSDILRQAISEDVDAVVIAGDLFHEAQVLPRTFAQTVETLEPLRQAGIPAIAIEGNHDWIHRRESISWMEALSAMGYLHLLRPTRDAEGNYSFPDWDQERRRGGHLQVKGVHFYGLGYIGAYAGRHVERIVGAMKSAGASENVLLFHVGVSQYCGGDVGHITEDEMQPLAEVFKYVALGHRHKPYVIPRHDPYAFNPGSPECVNFGEEKYGQKGFHRVVWRVGDKPEVTVVPTSPRAMFDERVPLDGCQNVAEAEERLREHLERLVNDQQSLIGIGDNRRPVIRVKLTGRVEFRPAEIARQRVVALANDIVRPLHVEYHNALSFATSSGSIEREQWSLAEIEREVVSKLFTAQSAYQDDAEKYTDLALRVKERLMDGTAEAAELLDMIHRALHET
jgi:DNA repair exonuclease SbcCD nuclease subunit